MVEPYLILYNTSKVLTMRGEQPGFPRAGTAMQNLGEVRHGAVVYSRRGIIEVGENDDILRRYPSPVEALNAHGRLAMPGMVDCHTHLVFAGDRSSEMQMRLQGATYLEILKSGGGINKTVQATRKASSDELVRLGLKRLDQMLSHGTTTVEVKSGYGLDEPTEEKILDVVHALEREHCMDFEITYLGAHTVPKGVDRKAYLQWLKGESLIRFQKKARFFDVFCEDGAFSHEETMELLIAAQNAGFSLKLHAGQFNDLSVCSPAAELGTVSIDHLDHISDDQLQTMARHQCVGVLLPGVPFFLQTGVYPDAKRFRQHGTPFALATDFNPGSCPSFSMQMMITLAVLKCHATLEEAICASTYNAACALKLGDRLGRLEKGMQADILVLDMEDYFELPYYFGGNLTHMVIKNGLQVHPQILH